MTRHNNPNPYLPPTHPEKAGTARNRHATNRRSQNPTEALREAVSLLREYQALLEAADPDQPEEVLDRINELLERLGDTSYSINVAIAAEQQQATLEASEGLAPQPPRIDASDFDAEAPYPHKYRAAFMLAKWRLRGAPLGCLQQLCYDLLFAGLSPELRHKVLREMQDAVRRGVVWMHEQNDDEGRCRVCGQEGISAEERLEHVERFDKEGR